MTTSTYSKEFGEYDQIPMNSYVPPYSTVVAPVAMEYDADRVIEPPGADVRYTRYPVASGVPVQCTTISPEPPPGPALRPDTAAGTVTLGGGGGGVVVMGVGVVAVGAGDGSTEGLGEACGDGVGDGDNDVVGDAIGGTGATFQSWVSPRTAAPPTRTPAAASIATPAARRRRT